MSLKIAIVGKGGSGKTTLAAGLSLIFSEKNKKVVAVDCDPDTNLGLTLGIPGAEDIQPICEMKDLIALRTGVESLDKPQAFFKINPKVDDIPDKFSLRHKNIRLLVMGRVDKASGGCMCPENTFMRSLVSHLVLSKNQVVILDMVAGSEHLGRATAKAVDVFIIVVEPSQVSLSTALRIKKLAEELKIKNIYFAGNKIQNEEDKDFIGKKIKNNLIGLISLNENLRRNKEGFVFDEVLHKEFYEIYQNLLRNN